MKPHKPSGRRLARGGGIAAALLLLIGSPALGIAVMEEYIIGVEDVLEVAMPDHPELTKIVPVRPDGNISLPLVDDIPAAGLTPELLKQKLTDAYRTFVTVPNITVIVSEINSLKVYVLGEVVKPGVYNIRGRTRVLQAIALAEGFTQYSEKDRVIILRDTGAKQERIEVNLKKVISGQDIGENRVLRPGDTVLVP